MLAINTTGEPVPFRLKLPKDQERVPILGESDAAELEYSVIEKEFAPFEVVVYGPFIVGN